jgi:hypothetical protein
VKITFLLLPLIFSFIIGKGQPQVFQDSLAQFSYLLFGSTVLNKENRPKKVLGKLATGFFIKKDERIYFVTAKHAITNHLNGGEQRNDFPENYNVYSHYSDQFNFLPMSAVWMSDSSKIKERLNDADIFTCQGTVKLNGFAISTGSLPKDPKGFIRSKSGYGEIRFFGFPEKMNKIENGIIQIAPPYLFTTKNFTIAQNFINQIGNEIGIDSLRYEVQIKDSKVTFALGGFSGAPVFIRTGQENKWEFLGVLVAINQIRNSIYIVKRDMVVREIHKLVENK